MPLGAARLIAPGDKPPTCGDLLSPGRFVLRSQFLKKQAAQLMKHPLFHQIVLHSPFTNEGTESKGNSIGLDQCTYAEPRSTTNSHSRSAADVQWMSGRDHSLRIVNCVALQTCRVVHNIVKLQERIEIADVLGQKCVR